MMHIHEHLKIGSMSLSKLLLSKYLMLISMRHTVEVQNRTDNNIFVNECHSLILVFQ